MVWSTVILVFLLIKLIVNFTNARCKSKVYLGGKTALITGGNSGLGLQLAKELASRGCKIIIADKDDASKTVKNLIKQTHNPNISCKMVNFASFKSVRLLAEEIKNDISKLDILVNNAGIAVAQHKMTEDGLQDITQINYLSHFLLTHLLLGLGLQLAKELASRGCKIIIADKEDASSTVKNLIKETHNPNISCKMVNFASFKSVRLFAEEIKKDVSKLDILVNNAGIAVGQSKMTEDGFQDMMQINYLSHFLLTHLLLDLLIKSSPSRIIYSSSLSAYADTPLTKDNLKAEKIEHNRMFYSGPYGNSKLAGAIMSKMLAKKLNGTGVTSNTFHPGLVKTEIWSKRKGNTFIMLYLWWAWTIFFGKNIDEGVQTLLHLACADEVEQISGQFFMECRPVFQPPKVHNDKFCEEIWSLSEEYVKLKHNEKIDRIIERINN